LIQDVKKSCTSCTMSRFGSPNPFTFSSFTLQNYRVLEVPDFRKSGSKENYVQEPPMHTIDAKKNILYIV
jgi:hypothetical protein